MRLADTTQQFIAFPGYPNSIQFKFINYSYYTNVNRTLLTTINFSNIPLINTSQSGNGLIKKMYLFHISPFSIVKKNCIKDKPLAKVVHISINL